LLFQFFYKKIEIFYYLLIVKYRINYNRINYNRMKYYCNTCYNHLKNIVEKKQFKFSKMYTIYYFCQNCKKITTVYDYLTLKDKITDMYFPEMKRNTKKILKNFL
jgi:hypothetical protein